MNIFLSFSRDDVDLATQIRDRLSQDGHKIFIYFHEIQGIPRDAFTSTLNETDIFISIFTKNATNDSWVSKEFRYVLGYVQERKKPIIIPIIFDAVEPPQDFSHLLYISASRNDLKTLFKILETTIAEISGKMLAQNDKQKETLEKVEGHIADYVHNAITSLEERERSYKTKAFWCYFVTFSALISSIFFCFWKIYYLTSGPLELASQIQISIISILVLSLIITIARFSFILGKSFMVESLRNYDRVHAISYGEFYLKAFGDKIDVSEIKEVFQNWNIDKGSYFSSQSPSEFDPDILKNILDLIRIVSGKSKK